MDVKIERSWKERLSQEFEKSYFRSLTDFVRQEYASKTIYPKGSLIFNAFEKTPFDMVKVVILGQDPYHEPGQAHGLCFSVNDGITLPPSLQNIYKELNDDLQIPPRTSGNLERWAEQGVLLLNTVLTVRRGQANSHKGKGWEIFTDRVIKLLNEREKPIVFILWGANAKAKSVYLTNINHMIITGAHPSPLSAHNGFLGGKYFSRTNEFLLQNGEKEIDWKIGI